MDTRTDNLKIKDLVDLRRSGFAKPNPEYQRGVVWNIDQQKKLIDSVLRGYQLPIIYLHDVKKTVAGLTQEYYDIIDGQQRMEALYLFAEGAFPLLNPNNSDARFPRFLADQPCPWSEKDFGSLSNEYKDIFLETELPVALIQSDDENEIRDLFVRLQAGSSLNAQERRDAYPGNFTDFVLKLGGKPAIARYPGHQFFQRVLGMKPSRDRGKTRQLAAQLVMLFLERRKKGQDFLPDINARAIDDYYYENLDFDPDTGDIKRLIEILDKLNVLLGDGKRPKLRAHDAIHLVLLLDSIWDEYVRSWEDTLPSAHDKFSARLAMAAKNQKDGVPDDFWNYYGVWTRSNSDRGENIRRRHNFYSQRMLEFLGNLTPKDPNRIFGPLEREIIYWRDAKRCAVCDAEALWDDTEIHHVEEHQEGGKTTIENGVLVHKKCHPKGTAAKEFADQHQQLKV